MPGLTVYEVGGFILWAPWGSLFAEVFFDAILEVLFGAFWCPTVPQRCHFDSILDTFWKLFRDMWEMRELSSRCSASSI